MTARRGFALISVIWIVMALATLLSLGLATVTTSRLASENRVHLRRARWAAAACVAFAQARQENDRLDLPVDSIALGPTAWCDAKDLNPRSRINPNRLDSVGLSRVLDPVRLAALFDWIDSDDVTRREGAENAWYRSHARRTPRNGPLQSVHELSLIRGFETLSRDSLEAVFTVHGDGRVSPNHASEVVLRSVGVLPPTAPARISALRATGRVFVSPEEVAYALGMTPTVAEFQALVQRLSFDTLRTTVRAQGWSNVGRRTVSHSTEVRLSGRMMQGAAR